MPVPRLTAPARRWHQGHGSRGMSRIVPHFQFRGDGLLCGMALMEEERSELAAIVEGSQDAIIGQALDGTITSWNGGAEHIYGYSAEEAIGRPISIIVPPERVGELPTVYERLIRGESLQLMETSRVTKSGRAIHISLRVSAIRNRRGAVVGFSSIARDITELMQAREERARLAAIVENSDDAIISKTLEGIVTSWNNAAERIFGYTAEEMIGRSITVIIPLDRIEEEPRIIEQLRRGERIDHYETIRRRKDGRLINISVTVSPLRGPNGEILGASKIARDITEQKRAQDEVQRSQKLLSDFVENATEGLHWVGPDGTIIWANRAELELLGYTREEYIGHPITEFHADEPVINDVLQRLSNNEKLESYEARLRCKDGSIRHVLINSNVYCENGRFIHTRCFTRDITARKQAEKALHNAREKLQQYAESLEQEVAKRTAHLQQTVQSLEGVCYSMAHDLRAPLRALQNYTQILLRDYAPGFDEEGRLFAERILSATGRMDLLIRNLLEFARLGHAELPAADLDLNKEIEAVLRQLAEEIQARHADVRVSSGLPSVRANPTIVQQVFGNLILNAVKFVPPGTRPIITIDGEQRGRMARVVVKDNGIGIAREHHDRIFGLFQRLHTGSEFPGTGVGLAIVRKGVERMGGRVTIQSEPGRGSCFGIELPLAEAV
jgi:PAS domain S-box-containing protein